MTLASNVATQSNTTDRPGERGGLANSLNGRVPRHEPRELGARVDVELCVHARQYAIHALRAEDHYVGDLPICHPAGGQARHLPLRRRELVGRCRANADTIELTTSL